MRKGTTRTRHPRLLSGTSDAVVAEVLNAPRAPCYRASELSSISGYQPDCAIRPKQSGLVVLT
jgi:hypothetical protein